MSDYKLDWADDFNLSWPTRDSRIFHEVHPSYGAVIAAESDERLYRMMNGFCDAANLLVEQSEAQPYFRRNFVYPIVCLYRQSLELRLKYLLIEFGLEANVAPDFRHHGLVDLWSRCKKVMGFFGEPREPEDDEIIGIVEANIAEFNAIDPGSYTFRFAHDTKGHKIDLPVNCVDLTNLRKVVMNLHEFLECLEWQLRYGH